MIISKPFLPLLFLPLLSISSQLYAAQAPFDIDVKELDREKPAAAPKETQKAKKAKQKPAPAAAVQGDGKGHKGHKAHKAHPPAAGAHHEGAGGEAAQTAAGEQGYLRYTVQPGDHIYKILVGRLGMSNEAADRLVPEIIRINNIENIKKLRVGQTLLIPKGSRRAVRAVPRQQAQESAQAAAHGEAAAPVSAGAGGGPAPKAVGAAQGPAPKAPESAAAANRQEVPRPAASPAPKVPAPAAAAVAPTAPAPATPIVPAQIPPSSATPAPATPSAAAQSVVSPSPGSPSPATPAVPSPQAAAPALEAPSSKPAQASVTPAAPPHVSAWVCSVADTDPVRVVDSVLNALELPWSKNRIVQSDEGSANAFSIRVDRYFELKGVRYIVTIGESDPYSYTLIRLLEAAGYRTAVVKFTDDFQATGEKLLRLVGQEPRFGRYLLQGDSEKVGFLAQQEDVEGRQVLLTAEPADPSFKRSMPAGCKLR